jgi:PAS domain-containing protein
MSPSSHLKRKHAKFPKHCVSYLFRISGPWTKSRNPEILSDRLRVFENRVLRRIFRRKRDELMGGLSKLCNKELRDLYSSLSIIGKIVKEDEMGRTCSMNAQNRNVYRILVRKPDGKRPLGRSRRWWVDSIKMDLRYLGGYGLASSG